MSSDSHDDHGHHKPSIYKQPVLISTILLIVLTVIITIIILGYDVTTGANTSTIKYLPVATALLFVIPVFTYQVHTQYDHHMLHLQEEKEHRHEGLEEYRQKYREARDWAPDPDNPLHTSRTVREEWQEYLVTMREHLKEGEHEYRSSSRQYARYSFLTALMWALFVASLWVLVGVLALSFYLAFAAPSFLWNTFWQDGLAHAYRAAVAQAKDPWKVLGSIMSALWHTGGESVWHILESQTQASWLLLVTLAYLIVGIIVVGSQFLFRLHAASLPSAAESH